MTMLLKDDVITTAMNHTLPDHENTLAQCRPNVVQRWAVIEPTLCIFWFVYGLFRSQVARFGRLSKLRCSTNVVYIGPALWTVDGH